MNVSSEDIYASNMRLILGLIWTLILRFEINAGKGIGKAQKEAQTGSADGGSGVNDLLEWVRKRIPEKNIKNFTTDWIDGQALCSLVNRPQLGGLLFQCGTICSLVQVNSFAPGLISELNEDALVNAVKGIEKVCAKYSFNKTTGLSDFCRRQGLGPPED